MKPDFGQGPDNTTEDFRVLARKLTLVENGLEGSRKILQELRPASTPVIGITGPPGAGKSTLVNAIINELSFSGNRIAVLAIDPTSPFNLGSLLGDRIRMSRQFNNPDIYIRSLATRGSLGGLSGRTIEMTDVLRSAGFDYIFIETVGVGQSEIEIAGLADKTVVVLVPEAGDEIQGIKSGIMEIADIFVINKADREGADAFTGIIKKLVHSRIPVLQTRAHLGEGITRLIAAMQSPTVNNSQRRLHLLIDKAWKLIRESRMQDVNRQALTLALTEASENAGFNLYRFIEKY